MLLRPIDVGKSMLNSMQRLRWRFLLHAGSKCVGILLLQFQQVLQWFGTCLETLTLIHGKSFQFLLFRALIHIKLR